MSLRCAMRSRSNLAVNCVPSRSTRIKEDSMERRWVEMIAVTAACVSLVASRGSGRGHGLADRVG